ncbi:hypothetical protein GCM10027053_24690 [Intrasporangium mesophilum]
MAQWTRHGSRCGVDHGWHWDRVRIASLIAMFVTDAVVVVTIARMLGGQRLGRGRVLWTCLAAATAFTIYAAIGIYGILGIEQAVE